MNHVIRTNDVSDKQFCAALCFIEENCFSYNIMTSGEGEKQNCELNNATHEGHENDLKADMDYVYSAAEVRLSQLLLSFPS